MLKERYTIIKMAIANVDGSIDDEVKLSSSFNLAKQLIKLKALDDEHCVVVERLEGKEWLYVEDSEMFK